MLYLLTSLLRNSKVFPFHLKVKSNVLSMAQATLRLFIICLSTPPTISDLICHSVSSPLCLNHPSFPFVACLYQAQSCLRAFPCLKCSSLDIHIASSLIHLLTDDFLRENRLLCSSRSFHLPCFSVFLHSYL